MTKLARPVAAAALTLVAATAAVAPTAQARPGVHVMVRHASAGALRVQARTAVAARRVAFSVDGHRRAVAARRPFARRISTRHLRRGRHVLTARATTRAGMVTGRRAFHVSARAAAAATADKLRARITAPQASATVHGTVDITADVTGGAGANRSIRAYADGKAIGVDVKAPWSVAWHTGGVRSGSHVLRVFAYDGLARGKSQFVTVNVPATASSGAPASSPAKPGWASTFESGTLDDWSVRNFGADNTGTIENVASGTDGVPAHSGGRMAKFQVTRAQSDSGHFHSKLYKIWTRSGGPLSSLHEDETGNVAPQMPAGNDMSGTYSAWFYFPSDYQRDPNVRDWTNIFHFKQWFSDKQVVGWGVYVSAASQWGGLRKPDGSPQWAGPSDQRAVMGVVAGGFGNWDYDLKPVPLGRWFELTAVVHQGDSIDWSIDGQPWRTVHQSRFPVGAVPDPADGESAPPNATIWSIGHYLGVGTDYVDDVSYTPSN